MSDRRIVNGKLSTARYKHHLPIMPSNAGESQEFDTTKPIRDAWYLTGPTAAGKTQIALHLARNLKAEIISVDSMAVYQGMDLGTAKPSVSERQQVPHHLIDIVSPDQEFSLWQYLQAAYAKFEEIRSRGREVLFVGGTPLYLKAEPQSTGITS